MEPEALNDLVRKYLARLEGLRPGVRAHSARVAVYSVATANQLGSDPYALLSIRVAAQLHVLDQTEWESFQGKTANWKGLPETREIWSQAEESWNGSGTPAGLAGTDICLGARIVAVCNRFDIQTMPPSNPSTERETLDRVYHQAGVLFDPQVVQAFLKVQPIIQPVGL